jgi:hypothetical protein
MKPKSRKEMPISDAGRSSKNGGVSTGCGSRRAELRARRRAQPHGSLNAAWKNIRIPQCAGCQVPRLPTERRRSNSRGSLRIVSGLAANTNSIFCDGLNGLRQGMDVRFCEGRNPCREAHVRTVSSKDTGVRALPSALGKVRVPLHKDLHGSRQTVEVVREAPEKPASRTCAPVGFRQQRNVPQ